MTTLVIVGGGKMGAALVGGLLEAGRRDLAVVERLSERRAELSALFESVAVVGDLHELVPVHEAVVAVKPGDVAATCAELRDATRVLSIAAGVTTARLAALLPTGCAVVRAMPNTPALVGLGVSAIAGHIAAPPDALDWAESILAAVGSVERVPESLLDAVTGLTGSGPAYLFLFAEALIDAGVLAGLPRPTAHRMVTQLLVGSAAMLADGSEPSARRAEVTSPGGTTAAGLLELERAAVRAAVAEAVGAATRRSQELGS
jgi:pyrroline-5-carboxylate reductase